MRVLFSFLFASVVAFSPAFSEQSKLDSLVSLLDRHKNEDTGSVDLMNMIAYEYVNKNPDIGFEYSNGAYQLAKKLDYKTGMARAISNWANSFWAKSEYEMALRHYLHALDIYKSQNDLKGTYVIYNNLGEVYKKLGKLDDALDYLNKSLKLKNEIAPDVYPAMSHNNIGEIYFMKKAYKRAIMEFETAEWMTIEMGNDQALAYAKAGLGKVYLRMKNYNESLMYLDEANVLWMDNSNIRGLAYVNLDLGRLNFETRNWNKAKIYLKNALEFAQSTGMRDIELDVFEHMQKLDSAKGDMTAALSRYHQYVQLKDSIFNIEKATLVADIQAKYELLEKDRINEQLSRAKEISEEIVNYQKIIIGAFIIILILIGVIAISFYRQVKRTHKLNVELESKNQEILINAKELALLNSDLEKMVEQRTSVIHQKNDQFKEYSFLNAHYVRGPLANIIGLSNLLDTGALDIEQRALLHHILNSCMKLDDVLHEIKDKLEKGEVID